VTVWFLVIVVAIAVGYWIWKAGRKAGQEERRRSRSEDAYTISFDVRTYEPYSKKNRGKDAEWVGPGEGVTIAGHEIPGGLLYLTERAADSRGKWDDPSLINRRLPVDDRAGEPFDEIGYWPSYSNLTPGNRARYLRWLSGGRIESGVDQGLLFIFFYGLERRVLDELLAGGAWCDELSTIAEEVRRLNGTYTYSNGYSSFQGYSDSFLTYLSCCESKLHGSMIRFPQRATRHWDVPLDVKVALGQLSSSGKPIAPPWAFHWAYNCPGISLRTPARRCKEEFKSLFLRLYSERYGDGMVISPNKTSLVVEYRPASRAVSHRSSRLDFELPDVTVLKRPVARLRELVEGCTSQLDDYSRALGRKSAASLGELLAALLPQPLLEDESAEDTSVTRDWLAGLLEPDKPVSVSVGDLLEKLPGGEIAQLTRKHWELIAMLLEKLGCGIEPDVRLGGQHPPLDGVVWLFRQDWEPVREASRRFRTASALLPFAVMVSSSDGVAAEELDLISGQLSQLAEWEQARLKARLNLLLGHPPQLHSLRAAVSGIESGQKRSIAQFLLLLAAADGRITPEEVQALERIYGMLDLDPDSLHSDIHALMTMQPSEAGKAPTTVMPARLSEPGYDLPPKPADEGVLVLNADAIERKRQESESVFAFLDAVLGDEEPPESAESEETEEPEEKRDFDLSLDEAHTKLMEGLLASSEMPAEKWSKLCDEVGLLPNAAIGAINEAVLELIDEMLIVSSDPVAVDATVAAIVRKNHG
jgi:hypothetical protein